MYLNRVSLQGYCEKRAKDYNKSYNGSSWGQSLRYYPLIQFSPHAISNDQQIVRTAELPYTSFVHIKFRTNFHDFQATQGEQAIDAFIGNMANKSEKYYRKLRRTDIQSIQTTASEDDLQDN